MEQNYNNTASSAGKDWPGAFGAYKPSRDAVRRNLGPLIWVWILDLVVAFVIDLIFPHIFGKVLGTVIGDLVGVVLSSVFGAALIYLFISSVRGKRVEVDEAIKTAFPFWWRMFLLGILVGLTVLGGIILFVVPGIIFALRLSQAPYFLIDRNLGVMEAYKASWAATKGNLGKIWGLVGVYILMVLPVITIVGAVVTIYLTLMYSASYALLYEFITKNSSPSKPAPSKT